MAITKSAKVEAEIGRIDAKIAEMQAKRKELVQKRIDIQNSEIVDIVRGMSIPLDELAVMLQIVKDGGHLSNGGPVTAPAPTSGQLGQKSEAPENDGEGAE